MLFLMQPRRSAFTNLLFIIFIHYSLTRLSLLLILYVPETGLTNFKVTFSSTRLTSWLPSSFSSLKHLWVKNYKLLRSELTF